jgi:hypothetical protein
MASTNVEIVVKTDGKKPKLVKLGNGEWELQFGTAAKPSGVAHLWVRTWDPDKPEVPKDGKGFAVGPTRKLRLVK